MARMMGIDLGHSAVNAVLYEGSFGRFQYKGAYRVPVPQDGGVPDLSVRIAAANAIVDEACPDGVRPQVVLAWPTLDASVRLVKLPFGDRAQVERTLPFEVEGQVPFDLDDVLLTHRIVSLSAGDSRVLVSLINRDALGARLQALQTGGLDPKNLVLDAELLGHLSTSGRQAVCDLGHTHITVSLVENGAVIAARALPGGGRDLTAALAAASGLGWAEAEAAKHALSVLPGAATATWDDDDDTNPAILAPRAPVRQLSGGQPVNLQAVLRAALDPQLAELRATLIAFEDTTGVEVEEVLLVGGGALLTGLPELLRDQLGVIVRLPATPDEGEDLRMQGQLALGLGRRAIGADRGAMELRVGDFAYKGDLGAVTSYVAYGLAALAAFLLAAVGIYGWQSYKLMRQREDAAAAIGQVVLDAYPGEVDEARLKDPTTALAILQEKVAAEQAQVEALESLLSDVPPTLNLLREISDGMPAPTEARVDVTELSVIESTVTLKIETDGFESATRIESSLKERPLFENATGGDSKKLGDVVRFTVTIPMGGPEDAAAGEEG